MKKEIQEKPIVVSDETWGKLRLNQECYNSESESENYNKGFSKMVNFLKAKDFSMSVLMQCPDCGSHEVHFLKPSYKDGNNNYESTEDSWVRGDVIEIPMYCEHGHEWIMQFGQHKGSLKLRNIHTDDAPSEPHSGRIWKELIKELENTTGESKFSDT